MPLDVPGRTHATLMNSTSLRPGKDKSSASAVAVSEEHGIRNVSDGILEAPQVEDGTLNMHKSDRPVIEDRKAQDKGSTELVQDSVSEKFRRSRRVLRETAEASSLEAITIDITRSAHPVSEGRVLRKHGVISDQQARDKDLPGSDKVVVSGSRESKGTAVERPQSTSQVGEGRILRKRNVSEKQAKENDIPGIDKDALKNRGIDVIATDIDNPSSEGRILRKRSIISNQEGCEKASPEFKKLNDSESPRRSSRLLYGVGKALGKPGVISDQQTQEVLPESDKVNVSEISGPEAIAIEAIKSASPVSQGRLLRKRNVVSNKQAKENATPDYDNNVSKSPGIGVLAVDTAHLLSEGRALRKRCAGSNQDTCEEASPEQKTAFVSDSPRRSSRLLNGVGEMFGVLETSRTKQAMETEAEVRVLRKRSNVIERQVQEQKSIESEDEEATVTWRSRRRKVQ